MLYIHSEGGWSDHEITDLSEEGRNMAGNNCGSENSGSLFR